MHKRPTAEECYINNMATSLSDYSPNRLSRCQAVVLHEIAANQGAGPTEASLAMHPTPLAWRKGFQYLQKFFRLSYWTAIVKARIGFA